MLDNKLKGQYRGEMALSLETTDPSSAAGGLLNTIRIQPIGRKESAQVNPLPCWYHLRFVVGGNHNKHNYAPIVQVAAEGHWQ